MRFEVPQFIEVEDKIVGPFTWRQFTYIAGGVGVAVISYVLLPFFLFVLLGMPVAVLAGFLAFHRVNNRPFSFFLESFFQYITNNKLYLWKRRKKQTITGQSTPKPVQKGGSVSKPAPERKLSSLSRQLTLDTLTSSQDSNEHEIEDLKNSEQ